MKYFKDAIMKESVKTLRAFLQKEYIDNEKMGSPNMKTAMRDVLIDLLHLGDKELVFVRELLETAQVVYEEEHDEELS